MKLIKCVKNCIIVLFLIVFSTNAKADFVQLDTDVTMNNFWERSGKDTQKVLNVQSKIVNLNKLNKRFPIILYSSPKIINAQAHYMDKSVYIYSGILPYIDNDDELAFIISHEIAHCIDYYDGPLKYFVMRINSKEYEIKADAIGIDMMVKAGYNPIAAICIMNKISGESVWDTWIFSSHPKGSVRLLKMYKYIHKKYPWALKSAMTNNVHYQNFIYSSQRDLNEFEIEQAHRKRKQNGDL
jgi:predicted Zn-dependent protease